MMLADVLHDIGVAECPETLTSGWDAAVDSQPDTPEFLQVEHLRRWREACGLDPVYDSLLADTARRVAGDPALRLLAWHGFRAAYCGSPVDFLQWPDLSGVLPRPDLFLLVLALAGVPMIAERCRQKRLPDHAAEGLWREIGAQCLRAQREAGTREPLGLPRAALTWLQHQVSGSARIGRFTYVRTQFNGYFEIYRHLDSQATLALANADMPFTAQGFMDLDPEHGAGWVSERHDSPDFVEGTPISPLGRALPERRRLARAQWRRVITYGEYALAIHVPGGAPLDPEACRASMRQAEAFFNEYFPESVSVCTLVSWIASPIVGRAVPATANLARFQAEAYLYPVPARGDEHLFRIFGPGPFDPATAPADTTLRKGVLAQLRRGQSWRWGGLFFLFEGLSHFGEQWYRTQWA